MAKSAILSIDIVSDASKAADGFSKAGSSATGLATDLGKVDAAATEADRKMRLTAEGADNLDSKSAQATGSLGALSSGFELVGLEKYAMGLQSAAMATDFFAGVGEGLNLILELQWVQSVKNVAIKVKDAIVTKAASIATRGWAIATAALNAVMAGNPIALVVLAIVALIAVIVIAYKRSETFRKIVDAAFSAIQRVIVGTVNAIVGFVTSHWRLLLAILTGPFGLAFLAIQKFGPNVVSSVSASLDRLRTAVFRALDRVLGLFRDLPGRIVRAVGDLGRLLYDAGVDILDGLLDGINDKWEDVKDKFSDITSAIPNIKGPPARDRNLLYGAGSLIMDGLLAGITSREGRLRSLLQGITRTITDGVSGTSLGGELDTSTVAGMRFRDGGNTYIVQGAVDPVSTAKQIRDLQRREATWTGRLVGVVS